MTCRKSAISALSIVTTALLLAASGAERSAAGDSNYNVVNFGAKGDGQTKDTRALQESIDACQRNGGGTVYFPPGTYLSGSLRLKSGVALHLDHGAVLKASKEEEDFDRYETLGFKNDADRETSFFHYALLWGEDVERIAISGTGVIDGNREKRGGPKPIALKKCKYVTIRDITITNSPNYCISLLGTDFVNIDGVTILNGYADGIDPDSCHHVRISNCHIESWDDAIVPKASFSLGYRRSVENLTVTNCILATNCNAFKLGTESGGDFKYITVSNCVLFDRPNMRPPISGIALESVDGSNIDGVTISNTSMINVRAPIFLRLGNRGRDTETPRPGSLKNVILSDIVATGAQKTCPISGIPDHPIEGLTLSNVRISYKGGGALEEAKIEPPENIAKYPEATMFGTLPAYGFYCRHVRGIKFLNVQLGFEASDLRHALAFDDVSNLEIDSLTAAAAVGAEPVIKFHHVREAVLRNCTPLSETNVFLKVSGTSCKGITLMGNDFSRVRRASELSHEVRKSAVVLISNRMPAANRKSLGH